FFQAEDGIRDLIVTGVQTCALPILMTSLTLGMDYWALALPRFIQGFAVGFIFVPLSTLALATIRRDKLVNATAVYGVLRNLGGKIGRASCRERCRTRVGAKDLKKRR